MPLLKNSSTAKINIIYNNVNASIWMPLSDIHNYTFSLLIDYVFNLKIDEYSMKKETVPARTANLHFPSGEISSLLFY